MKKIFSLFACSAALMLTACSDNELSNGVASEGDAIIFVANVDANNVATRTVYGPQQTDKSYPIYWVDGDQVDVFCPQAQNGAEGQNHKNKAVLTVHHTESANAGSSYALTGDQESLYWGAEDNHDFYAFYPAGNVTSWTPGNDGSCTITASVPATQSIDVTNEKQFQGEAIKEGGITYNVACNMNYALMATRTKTTKSRLNFQKEDSSERIPLNFNPLNTAVTITIDPADNVLYNVNSITIANADDVENDIAIAGDFQCTIGNDGNLTSAPVVTSSNPVKNIQFEFTKPVEIGDGVGLKFTVFLLPNASTHLKVSVNADTAPETASESPKHVYISKQANVTKVEQKLVANGHNLMNLKSLPSISTKVEGDRWQSVIKNRVYLSQLSLPGAYDAANFADEVSRCDRAQTGFGDDGTGSTAIPYMFNHGIRVFDLKLSRTNDNSGFYINRLGTFGGKPTKIAFKNIMTQATQWLKTHTTEFLIFMLSDYDKNNANWDSQIQSLIEESFDDPNSYLVDFPADITVEEARGKVLFINCSSSTYGTAMGGWYQYDKENCLGLSSQNVSGANFAFSDGNIWVEDYNNAEGAESREGFWPIYFYRHRIKSDEIDKKKDLITASLNKAKGNNDPKQWYITSSALRYHVPEGVDLGGDDGNHAYCSGYADLAQSDFNPYVTAYVKGLSKTSYQKTGIVMAIYVCTGDGNQKGQALVDAVWDNNFVGNGPLQAGKQ